MRTSGKPTHAVFLSLLCLALITGCQDRNGGPAENGGDGETTDEAPTARKSIVVLEPGDTGGDCDSCEELTDLPVAVQGTFRSLPGPDGKPVSDVDCYCFTGDPETTYLIGITGNGRFLAAKGAGETDPTAGNDGLLLYQPSQDGKVCACVQGGKNPAYLLTITPE